MKCYFVHLNIYFVFAFIQKSIIKIFADKIHSIFEIDNIIIQHFQ